MKQARSTETLERIIREAEHLIHLRGYHCTSLDDIAKRCRMTKANLLHHFQSKEDLGLAVLDYKIAAYRNCFLNPLFSDQPDPLQAVSKLFHKAGDFYRNNGCKAGCFIANMALEMSDLNDRFRERAGEFFEEWTDRIEKLLEHHKSCGYFAKTMKPRACAESILSLYEGAIMLARTRRDPLVFDRVGETAVTMLRMHKTIHPAHRLSAVNT